jgi:hypothetical protein
MEEVGREGEGGSAAAKAHKLLNAPVNGIWMRGFRKSPMRVYCTVVVLDRRAAAGATRIIEGLGDQMGAPSS